MSFISIGLGALLHGTLSGWWAEYKKRHQDGAVPMGKRNGVWQPSRIIPRVERVIDWLSYVGMAGIAVGAVAAIYVNFFMPT
jgi:hypothetical protein